jgi:hypothetical protein
VELKELLSEVANEIAAVQHGDRIGDGHDLLMQRLDALRARIGEALKADDACIAAELAERQRNQ